MPLRHNNKFQQPLNLRLNFLWALFGYSVYAACQWGILVVIAKIGNPEMVGMFTLGLAITSPIILFTNFNLRAIQASDTKNEYNFSEYLVLRIITLFFAQIIILLILFITSYDFLMKLVIIFIGISKTIEAMSDIIHGLFQKNERMDRVAISLIIKGPLSIVAVLLGISLSGNLLGGLIALVINWFLVLLFYDIRNAANLNIKYKKIMLSNFQRTLKTIKKNRLEKLLILAFPLSIVMMLNSLNTNIPRYFIDYHLDKYHLGIFSAISYLIVTGNLIVNALGQAAIPKLSMYYNDFKFRQFLILLGKLLLIGFFIGLVGILIANFLGKEILTIIYSEEYGNYTNILVLTMLGAAIIYVSSFFSFAMMAARFLKIQIPLSIIIASITALFSYILIPEYGLIGACWAVIAGFCVKFLSGFFVNLYIINKLYRKYLYVRG